MTINTREGKITATPETLNIISILAREAKENFENKGFNALAEMAESVSYEIYKALEANGHYK